MDDGNNFGTPRKPRVVDDPVIKIGDYGAKGKPRIIPEPSVRTISNLKSDQEANSYPKPKNLPLGP